MTWINQGNVTKFMEFWGSENIVHEFRKKIIELQNHAEVMHFQLHKDFNSPLLMHLEHSVGMDEPTSEDMSSSFLIDSLQQVEQPLRHFGENDQEKMQKYEMDDAEIKRNFKEEHEMIAVTSKHNEQTSGNEFSFNVENVHLNEVVKGELSPSSLVLTSLQRQSLGNNDAFVQLEAELDGARAFLDHIRGCFFEAGSHIKIVQKVSDDLYAAIQEAWSGLTSLQKDLGLRHEVFVQNQAQTLQEVTDKALIELQDDHVTKNFNLNKHEPLHMEQVYSVVKEQLMKKNTMLEELIESQKRLGITLNEKDTELRRTKECILNDYKDLQLLREESHGCHEKVNGLISEATTITNDLKEWCAFANQQMMQRGLALSHLQSELAYASSSLMNLNLPKDQFEVALDYPPAPTSPSNFSNGSSPENPVAATSLEFKLLDEEDPNVNGNSCERDSLLPENERESSGSYHSVSSEKHVAHALVFHDSDEESRILCRKTDLRMSGITSFEKDPHDIPEAKQTAIEWKDGIASTEGCTNALDVMFNQESIQRFLLQDEIKENQPIILQLQMLQLDGVSDPEASFKEEALKQNEPSTYNEERILEIGGILFGCMEAKPEDLTEVEDESVAHKIVDQRQTLAINAVPSMEHHSIVSDIHSPAHLEPTMCVEIPEKLFKVDEFDQRHLIAWDEGHDVFLSKDLRLKGQAWQELLEGSLDTDLFISKSEITQQIECINDVCLTEDNDKLSAHSAFQKAMCDEMMPGTDEMVSKRFIYCGLASTLSRVESLLLNVQNAYQGTGSISTSWLEVQQAYKEILAAKEALDLLQFLERQVKSVTWEDELWNMKEDEGHENAILESIHTEDLQELHSDPISDQPQTQPSFIINEVEGDQRRESTYMEPGTTQENQSFKGLQHKGLLHFNLNLQRQQYSKLKQEVSELCKQADKGKRLLDLEKLDAQKLRTEAQLLSKKISREVCEFSKFHEIAMEAKDLTIQTLRSKLSALLKSCNTADDTDHSDVATKQIKFLKDQLESQFRISSTMQQHINKMTNRFNSQVRELKKVNHSRDAVMVELEALQGELNLAMQRLQEMASEKQAVLLKLENKEKELMKLQEHNIDLVCERLDLEKSAKALCKKSSNIKDQILATKHLQSKSSGIYLQS